MKKTMLIMLFCLGVKAAQADEYKRRRMFDAIETLDCQKVRTIAEEGLCGQEDGAKFIAYARTIAKELNSRKRDWLGLIVGSGLCFASFAALGSMFDDYRRMNYRRSYDNSEQTNFPIAKFTAGWAAVGIGGACLLGRAIINEKRTRSSKLAAAANLEFLEKFYAWPISEVRVS